MSTTAGVTDASPSAKFNAEIDKLCVNTVRCLGADMPQKANSGHPGAPMGCAPIAHILWGYVMKFSPNCPNWPNRDRFVLSNGHACALLYSMLHLTGYEVTLNDLKNFRKVGSNTPGHPECFATPGVEVCTGPLGQGLCNAVGMAIAAQHFANQYNLDDFSLFDNFVYCLCGDGCLQEGLTHEASSLAGHLGLGNLILLYDDNNITIDGETSLSVSENTKLRFESYGWETFQIPDGDSDLNNIFNCIECAKKNTSKPSIIFVNTTIGFGSLKAGTEKVHGAPLGGSDVSQLKERFGFDPNAEFQIPDKVLEFYHSRGEMGNAAAMKWKETLSKYVQLYPQKGTELERRLRGELPAGVLDLLPKFSAGDGAAATRALSGDVLNILNKALPELIGGSADLKKSNCTDLNDNIGLQKNSKGSRYIYYGIREHGMLAITNGICSYGGFRVFAATFLNFVMYGWGAVRLAALSRFPALIVATHDSIELGEDGPTHQPIEVLSVCRATPNLLTIRPADGNEVSGAYAVWLNSKETPVVLSLCRSGVPQLQNSSAEAVKFGAYVLSDFSYNDKPKILIASCGSELNVVMAAKQSLVEQNVDVRVVSMPCWELFEQQTDQYKQATLCIHQRLNKSVVTMYVEPAATFGWKQYFDIHLGMNSFGASGPKSDVMKYFGFTKENIAQMALSALEKNV